MGVTKFTNGSYQSQFNEIKNDIQNMANVFSYTLAKKAENDFVEAEKQIVKNYYDAYSPKRYNRNSGFRKLLLNHTVRSIGDKTSYITNIKVGSGQIDSDYNISPDIVFDLMWNNGIRGLPEYGSEPLSHSFKYYIGNRLVNFGFQGEPWHNPYWDQETYSNMFMTTVTIDKYKTSKAMIPHEVMCDLRDQWWDKIGTVECDKIAEQVKSMDSVKSIK